MCEVCGNTNELNTRVNENKGKEVCLGFDGKGCSHVLYINRFTVCYAPVYDDAVEKLFSVQAAFPSQNKYGCKKFKRLNNCIEGDLGRYGRDDAITCDFYKDEQRKEVYDIVDRVQISVAIDKALFKLQRYSFISSERKCTEFINLKWLYVVCCILSLMRIKHSFFQVAVFF